MATDIPLARRDEIRNRLLSGQAVVAAALAAEFNLSEDAIRRDLRALAAEGHCRRVYGGALPLGPGAKPLAARLDEGRSSKDTLARAAAATIRRGEFLFLDTGSTNLALVEHLPEDFGLTVATNSVDIAAAVLHRGDLPLILTGGSVDLQVGGCIDAAAVQAVAALHIDRCFVGACALSAKTGLSASHHGDAQFKRALVDASQVRIALVTNDKLDTQAPHQVMALSELDLVMVESSAAPHILDALRQRGAVMRLAEPLQSECSVGTSA